MPRRVGQPEIDEMLPLTPLSLAILLSLAEEDRHGYAIMKDVEAQTRGEVTVGTGSLYAALQRMVDEGLIEESPEAPDPDEDQRRKYYRVTESGREVSRAEARRLARVLEVAENRRLLPEGWPGTRPAEGA